MPLHYSRSFSCLIGLLVIGSAGTGHTDSSRAAAATALAGAASQLAAAPGAFVRQGDRVVTGTQRRREWSRARAGLPADAPSPEAREDRLLEAEFPGDYARGLKLSLASHPRAFVRLVPLGARPASARVREDGAVLTFEGAFASVTAAFGGTPHRLVEHRTVRLAADLAAPRFALSVGPEFGQWVAADGQLWAFDDQGKSLFVLAPPALTDAAGKRVVGSWVREGEPGAERLRAVLDRAGLVFPVTVELAAEAPEWFQEAGGLPGARAGTAGGYDAVRGCVALFGGAGANFTPHNEIFTRCAGGWQRVSTTSAEAEAPPTLAYATLTFAGFAAPADRLYLFGGYPGDAASAPSDELHGLALGSDGARGEWSRIETAGPRPAGRFFHGAAYDTARRRLIVWGGVDRQGQLLADTWAFTPSPPTWTRLCEGCFDARYGLTAVTQGTVATGLVISSLGGYDRAGAGGRLHNDVQRFQPDCPGGACWSKPPATGAPPAEDPAAPAPRFLAWGARDASDQIVWGSGVASGESRLTDAWRLDAQGRWSPLGAGQPGPRESAVAVYDEAHREIVLVGGVADESGARLSEGSLLHRGSGATASLTVRQTAARTYALRGRLPGPRGDGALLGEAEGYFVGRDAATLRWEDLGGNCGTAAAPLASANLEISCTVLASRTYDLIDFRVREAEFYSNNQAPVGPKAPASGAPHGEPSAEAHPYVSAVSGCPLAAAVGVQTSCR